MGDRRSTDHPADAAWSGPSAQAGSVEHSVHAEWAYSIFAVFGTGAGTLFAVDHALRRGVDVFFPLLCLGLLLLNAVCVTGGLHRGLAHGGYRAHPWLRRGMLAVAVSAGQGFPIRWVFEHRLHHRRADQPGDPHSPYFDGTRPLGFAHGILHAHVLWLFKPRPVIDPRAVRDLLRDPTVVWLDRHAPWITLVGLLVPGVLALGREATLEAFGAGVLWGGLVRLFLLYHISWSVNSLCHRGGRSQGALVARNRPLFGLLAAGEGWHQNHHQFPASARHGFGRTQPDLTWWVLSRLARLGLVWDLKLPHAPPQEPQAKTGAVVSDAEV